VLDATGPAVAAVAVPGPAMRLLDDRLATVANQIVETTEVIGPVLGSAG
jgi:DNA-binding IclR family transcriptional regulator